MRELKVQTKSSGMFIQGMEVDVLVCLRETNDKYSKRVFSDCTTGVVVDKVEDILFILLKEEVDLSEFDKVYVRPIELYECAIM